MRHRQIAAAGATIIAALVLGVVSFSGSATAQSGVVFSVQPERAPGDDAPYFSYAGQPGERIDDTALVINAGGEAVTLRLYAADGITAIGGGTAFAGPDEDRTGVRLWIRSSVSEVTLAPGARQSVRFSVTVPADAASGDHVAGLIIEAPPKAGQAGGVQTSVVERVGVAVVVRVPGEASEQLALGGICLNQETGSNYFQVPVANNGNVLSRPSGEFTLQRQGGKEVFRKPIEPATILARDATFLRVDAPIDPGPGRYTAIVRLNQSDGRVTEGSTVLRIGPRKENGCEAADAIPAATAVVLGAGVLPDAGEDGEFPILTVSLIGVIALLALLLAASEILRRRRRATGPK